MQATQLIGGTPGGAVGEFEGDVGVREESQSRINVNRFKRAPAGPASRNPSQVECRDCDRSITGLMTLVPQVPS